MALRLLCDFVNHKGTRVRLEEFAYEPVLNLSVGGRRCRATLYVEHATELRDALSEFLERAEKAAAC